MRPLVNVGGVTTNDWVQAQRTRFRSVVPRHKKGAEILGVVSIVVLVGVTVTGLWQFFAHEANPDWYAYVPDSGFTADAVPSTGMARIHGFFADASFVVAMIGGGWFAYNIAFTVPRTVIVAFITTFVGVLTGGIVRFNVVKLSGRTHEEAGAGYLQLFTNSVDYVVNGRTEFGATGFRLLTLLHVATVPILVVFAWIAISRALAQQREARWGAPTRSWMQSEPRTD